MSEVNSTTPSTNTVANTTTEEKKPLKICCACPETKRFTYIFQIKLIESHRARDECVVIYGEKKCSELIEAHNECLRQHGFKV